MTASNTDALILDLHQQVQALASEVRALRQALPSQLVDVPTAATLAGVSEKTIRRRIRSGEIPSRRIGRSVRVDPTKLRALDTDEVAEPNSRRAA